MLYFCGVKLLIFGTMRKFFCLMAVSLAVLTAQAQWEIETLQVTTVDADPMTGTEGGLMWVSNKVSIYAPINGAWRVVLMNPDRIFVNGVTRIGYYTKENELIGMSDYCYTNISDDGRRLVFTLFFSKDSLPLSQYSDDYYYKKSWRVRVKEMCEWLLHTDGYVRIVSSVYGGGVHDVRFRLKEDEE